MTSIETRAAFQLTDLLAENAARPLDSGLTPDQAIADLEAALTASLNGTDPEPTSPAPVAVAPTPVEGSAEQGATVTARVRAAMKADLLHAPSVEDMTAVILERAAPLADAGTVWAVWHRKPDSSQVLCEFDGCVCYEAYPTHADAVRAAKQADDCWSGAYVAGPVPAGLACCLDGEILRAGGESFPWLAFMDAGFFCVRLPAPVEAIPTPAVGMDAPAMVPQQAQEQQGRDMRAGPNVMRATAQAFQDADEAWGEALRREFGRRAAEARYSPAGKGDTGSALRALYCARYAAYSAWCEARCMPVMPDPACSAVTVKPSCDRATA